MPADRRRRGGAGLSLRTLLLVLVVMSLLAVAVASRLRHIYPVEGTLASEGPGLNNWSSRPDACSLDPQDGQPAGHSQTALVLSWFDVTLDDPTRNFDHWLTLHDVPQRLDIERTPDGLSAILTTTKTDDPLVLDGKACRVLSLQTKPAAPLVTGAQPAVKGTLDVDCTAEARHISGHLKFDRCGL
jgi:hypothetical protein